MTAFIHYDHFEIQTKDELEQSWMNPCFVLADISAMADFF